MTLNKQSYTQTVKYLPDFFDVDDGAREVPVNMTLTSEGFLQKDTGFEAFLASYTFSNPISWIKEYKKKNGDVYFLIASGNLLYNADLSKNTPYPLPSSYSIKSGTLSLTQNSASVVGVSTAFTTDLAVNDYITIYGKDLGVATMTIASPCVVSKISHGLVAGDKINFKTSGALPTGLAVDTDYYVISAGLTADAFQIATSAEGVAIDTSGSQSGTHNLVKVLSKVEIAKVVTITDNTNITLDTGVQVATASYFYKKNTNKTFTGTEFGGVVYNDVLYAGNTLESFSFDGGSITNINIPNGNIFDVFEDRIFVSGIVKEPLSIYYSDTANPTTFQTTSVIKPLGTDRVTGLANYYGSLLLFKYDSIWKMTFIYDQVAQAFLPKIELLNKNYGCVGRKAYGWVLNDIWFFNGLEIRAIGFRDQQAGVLGVDPNTISNPIKETLKLVSPSLYDKVILFYNKNKMYLFLPLSDKIDTVFISHLLYKNSWCKIKNREKSKILCIEKVNGEVYFGSNVANKMYKWNSSFLDVDQAISSYVNFKEYESKDFSQTNIFRYIDLKFKNLQSNVTHNIWVDHFDIRTKKSKEAFIGTEVEGQDNALGEVTIGNNLIADAFGEDVISSNFVKRRISMLAKGSILQFGLANNTKNESFTIVGFEITGLLNSRRYYSHKKIISI